MNALKQRWEQVLARVNALSVRERLILLASVLVGFGALADALWLTPAQNQYKKVQQAAQAQNAELARLRTEFMQVTGAANPNQQIQDDIAQTQRKLEALNGQLDALMPSARSGSALEQALIELLRKHEGLTLLAIQTTGGAAPTGSAAPAAVVAADAPAATAATTAPAAGVAALPGLTRTTLDLRVQGPYPEMVRYLQSLERALPYLRWGPLHLQSEKLPPVLSLQVYVMGIQTP